MSRLRNRIRKADYFTDGELLRWPRDKRTTYSGLWAMAEDSGCLEDDCFEWKMALWPSPLDADITVDVLERWRDELIESGKLIPYEADGKRYLYLRNFHQHEKPTNPQRPDLPTPPWVRADVTEGRSKDGKRWVRCQFAVCTDLVPPRPGTGAESVPTLSRPESMADLGPQFSALQDPALQSTSKNASGESAPARVGPVDNLPSDDPEHRRSATKGTKSKAPPTCDGEPCRVRDLRCDIRRDVELIAGIEGATLYGGHSDLSKTTLRYAARLCELCQEQFGETPRPQRDEKCQAVMKAAIGRVLAAHRSKPIDNLPAYLNGELKRLTHLGDLCGDDVVAELRGPERSARKSEPRRVGELMPPGLSQAQPASLSCPSGPTS